MKKITIAVASKRGPKLNAVTEAFEAFSGLLAHDAQFEVLGMEVESGVSHTPASRDELMRGARQRVEALQEKARQDGAAWQFSRPGSFITDIDGLVHGEQQHQFQLASHQGAHV